MSTQELKPDVSLSPASATLNSENPGSNPNSSNNDNDSNEVGSAGGNNSKERRKIEIKFIENKTRRHVTFSKRKHGIMKKAFELSVLTGTQVLLLVVSETGLVYTFSTPKFEPIVTQQEGRNLIQACLNAPDEEEEEEEEEDEEAQRQRLAAQTQQQLAQQQLAQQHAQQAQQHQVAMQNVQNVQSGQQSQQTQQPGQVPLPNAQMGQQQQGALQLQPENGQDHHQTFSMDGFATPRQVDNDSNNNNINNNGSKHQDPSGNGQQGDNDGNNNNPNNANNPAYQQYFQSSQQPAQF
ncbi:pheromone receptor transcription factor [Monosporozyma servazzii]